MFKIGDKVFDSHTHQIGTVSHISIGETETYPLIVDFTDTVCTYTRKGTCNLRTEGRHIKRVDDISGIVKVGPTHICLTVSSKTYLLPIALTSFKVVNDINYSYLLWKSIRSVYR